MNYSWLPGTLNSTMPIHYEFSFFHTEKVVLKKETFHKMSVYIKKTFLFSRGTDFRPEYREAGKLPSIAGKPALFLTATCPRKVRDDILSSVALETSEVTQFAVLPDRYVHVNHDLHRNYSSYYKIILHSI